jgi:anaerobic selenocysteine-containing dehydrogenase
MGGEITLKLTDIIAKLPEADRAEAEKAIGEAVAAGNILAGIDTQEKAFEFIKKTPIFRSAFDAEISNTVKAHDEKFIAEKVPKLVEAEIKKLNGPETDPIKLELAQIKAELEAKKTEERKAKQLSIALKLAADEKIPADDIERFIGEDDKATSESVKAYAARIKAWTQSQTDAVLKEKLGNVGRPTGGLAATPGSKLANLEVAYKEAQKAGQRDQADRIYVEMMQEKKNTPA